MSPQSGNYGALRCFKHRTGIEILEIATVEQCFLWTIVQGSLPDVKSAFPMVQYSKILGK